MLLGVIITSSSTPATPTKSKKRNNKSPKYYGEVQPWAKIVKGLLSFVSLAVFMTALLGGNHDVRGFYSSLFLSSSPVFIDLVVVYISIREDTNILKRTKWIFLSAFIASAFCFAFSLYILISGGNDIALLDAYLSGKCWESTYLLFPIIIYPFCINVIRPIETTQSQVKSEDRNPIQG